MGWRRYVHVDLRWFRRARRVLGPKHAGTARLQMDALGVVRLDRKKYAQAEAVLRECEACSQARIADPVVDRLAQQNLKPGKAL